MLLTMKYITRISARMATVMLALCSLWPLLAEEPLMKVRFDANAIVRDKETGDTIHFVDHELFSLPDTTNLGNLYTAVPPNKLIIGVEAPVGSKFLIRVRTHVPDKKWYETPEKQKEYGYLVKYLKEVQGQHETVWLGPFTVPDTTNTSDGAVKFILPDVKLTRVK